MNHDDYSDIINLPHHRSTVHKPMSMKQRAAQFSPFAALTGYGERVEDAKRVVDSRRILSDDAVVELNRTLNILQSVIMSSPSIDVTYFVTDKVKLSGGKYETKTGELVKIDNYANMLMFSDGTEINMGDVKDIVIL